MSNARKILDDEEFANKMKSAKNPYGMGNAAELMIKIIEDANEKTVMIEHEFEDDLEDGDKLVLIVDQAFYDANDYLVVRDMKTTLNKLKYTQDDVMYNQQLYMYLPYVENELSHKVDAIEIDEIKLAKLKPVPLKANGKPSIDKKQLDLVTYEDYYEW